MASRSICCRIACGELDWTVVELEVVSPKLRVASVRTSENMTTPTSIQRHHGTGQSEASLVSAFPTTTSSLIIPAACREAIVLIEFFQLRFLILAVYEYLKGARMSGPIGA